MSVNIYNPELGKRVIAEHRQFPEITESPGIQPQPELRTVFEPVMQRFFERFGGVEYPVIASFDRQGEGNRYGLVINRPDALWASFGTLSDPHQPEEWRDYETWLAAMKSETPEETKTRLQRQKYNSVHLFINPATHVQANEWLAFNHSNHNYSLRRSSERAGEWGYHFGVCSGFMSIEARDFDTPEKLAEAQDSFETKLGMLTVGSELLEEDLSAGDREHLYWTSVILDTYFKFKTVHRHEFPRLATGPWLTRAPSTNYLRHVVEEMNPNVPDTKSKHLVPFLLHSARQAMRHTRTPNFRVGEEYTESSD